MLNLKLPTDPRWVNLAEKKLADILTDHAYCEQKAATSCISLIIVYPDLKPIVEQITPIVSEEWNHFSMVLNEIYKRGFVLGYPRKDEYVNELLKFQKKKHNISFEKDRKLLFNGSIYNDIEKDNSLTAEQEILNLLKDNNDLDRIDKMLIADINGYLPNDLLVKMDRMSMAHGVEGRYPYLDDIFADELAKISSKIKSPGLKLKNILRHAFIKYLPKSVISRPKFAYQAPEARVFFDNNKNSIIIDEFIDSLSNQNNLKVEPFLNLIKKFKDTNSSLRLSFRENMAFIIGLSDHFLIKSSKNWAQFKSEDSKRAIKYVYHK